MKLTDHPRNPAVPYVAAVPARVKLPEPKVLLNWRWLKIERRMHLRYGGMETHITMTIWPWRRRFWAPEHDNIVLARPAFFIAFGRVPVSSTGWHARGAINPVDIVTRDYPRWATKAHKPEEDMFRKWS